MQSSKTAPFIIGVILALGAGLAVGYVAARQRTRPEVPVASSPTATASSPETVVLTPTETTQPAPISAYLARPASAEEMYGQFICPCCGQLIGECTCGMAGERRGFVNGLAAAGLNKLGMYLAYADEYGLDTFASQEVKEEIRAYKLAHAPEERPQIVLEPQKVDLGDVSAAGGKAETSITIENTGQADLIIDSLSTSCGCTTASVVNHGEEGPVFGSGTPAEGWATTIRPGETAELKVYYDPTVHEDARGAMMREIYVSSNDPVDPVVKARIQLNQVD